MTKNENVFEMGLEPIKSVFDRIDMDEKHKRSTNLIEFIAKNMVL